MVNEYELDGHGNPVSVVPKIAGTSDTAFADFMRMGGTTELLDLATAEKIANPPETTINGAYELMAQDPNAINIPKGR